MIARGSSFIGPYLPLTDKFAAGGFIRDALAGGPVGIREQWQPDTQLYLPPTSPSACSRPAERQTQTSIDMGQEQGYEPRGNWPLLIAEIDGQVRVETGRSPSNRRDRNVHSLHSTSARSELAWMYSLRSTACESNCQLGTRTSWACIRDWGETHRSRRLTHTPPPPPPPDSASPDRILHRFESGPCAVAHHRRPSRRPD